MLFVCIFFFKQKTAYEMRISDWSSDVCSSDLLTPAISHIHPFRQQQIGQPDRGADEDFLDIAGEERLDRFANRRRQVGCAADIMSDQQLEDDVDAPGDRKSVV